MEEQGTHKPLVVSSNLTLAICERLWRAAQVRQMDGPALSRAVLLGTRRRCGMEISELPTYLSLSQAVEQYGVSRAQLRQICNPKLV